MRVLLFVLNTLVFVYKKKNLSSLNKVKQTIRDIIILVVDVVAFHNGSVSSKTYHVPFDWRCLFSQSIYHQLIILIALMYQDKIIEDICSVIT